MLLRDAARRFVAREYGFEARGRRMAEPDGFCRRTWRQMADIGLVAAGLPAQGGGLGAGAVGTMIVAEALGSVLAVEPYLATAVLGAGALELGGSGEHRARLAEVAEGSRLLAFAHFEEAEPTTAARADGDGFLLDGSKLVVLHAAAADELVVTASVPGEQPGTALFLVPRDSPGIRLGSYRTSDGLPAADVTLSGVRVAAGARLGAPGDDLLERVLDRARAAMCAEAVGAMDALLARTIGYLRSRQQFGVPLARFQALQHRVADMAMEVEQARSMMLVAALCADEPDRRRRVRQVSAAAACVARAARFVGQQAVQLHGGIGMTDALDVSHYFKRLAVIARSIGDESLQLERFLAASGR